MNFKKSKKCKQAMTKMMRTIDDLYMDMKVVAFLQMIFGASISWPLFSDVSKAAC